MEMNYRYSGSAAYCGFLEEFEKDEFKAQMREMIQYLIEVYEEMIANEEDEDNEGN